MPRRFPDNPRRNSQAQLVIGLLLVIAGVIALVLYLRSQQAQTPPTSAAADANMLLGNPSGATADPANRDNYLMLKPYFALSYNNSKGTPNWVSWRVTESDLGNAPRARGFEPDADLPSPFRHVTTHDYSASGFDRGHLCPHGDRSADDRMSFATFVMTNMIPQAANVNRKAWEDLESYCRELVRRQHQRLYITAGPGGVGGVGSEGPRETIGRIGVTVPAECWKIVVAVPGGGEDDLAKIGPDTRVIAVVMPNNNNSVERAWAKYRTNAADIEGRTRFRFFDRVSASVADSLRQKVDTTPIAPPENRTTDDGRDDRR